MNTIIETDRLFLREMNMDDYDALYLVLGDPDNMRYYPYSFDEERVRSWIGRNMTRYHENGFGLWAVCLKDTGEMIGDCGLTLQNIDGKLLPEIGYHIRGNCQRRGYAGEAARAVRNWAFRNTDYDALYSYCTAANVASYRTAESVGMHFDRDYMDEANGMMHVSVIRRDDLIRNMIGWAEKKLGGTEYAGWCLLFIEDALEISNGLEIFGGDSAKESSELYSDAIKTGLPEKGAFVFYDCLCRSENGLVNWGHCGISYGDGRVIHAWDKVRIDGYRQIEEMTAASGDHPRYIGWVPLARVLKQKP